ncbi:MAG: cbb3-type cytochrome c oxidase subunit I [Opitutales bacterium]|jgi:cytochrome c oxidase cbb3-type subunit I|nr:cbb3-type cytochrome c oxidase subunit I [Opitutales bacterium]MDP4658729.1 cbb3-type cytochrome c oxidase subunit I [Opitutales bacterium]MDP4774541.1 cbb3-type cytochrome c oxidase subunit I [Opitutales bacterium]MDP4787710.1 cbb3-type cytochrome c oxidase subunit I [Opitutales bacterium]MDP4860905.1 cbb3-type cytochrome c oxidase subunit I [Opitutales bacterium]
MTQDNRSGRPQGRPPEGDGRVSRVEASLRGPFLLFFVSAVIWLLAASVLGVIAALGLGSSVGVLRDCAWFTPGRIAAAQQDLFIYGWGFNAFFALNLWLLAQLGRFEFRNGWLAQLGGVAWNLALTYGIARVFAGDMTGYRLLDFPREVGPVLAVAFLLAGFWPIVAFARRPSGHTFASQWFVVGASFAFPLVYLLAQLLVLWQPASGVVQALAHSWFVANLLQLWFGASALAAIYYFLPKVLERTLTGYYLAPVAFWTFFLFAGWTGPAALVGSPVPLWLQSTGVVAAAMMIIPVIIVAINVHGTLCSQGGWARAWNDTTLRFVSFGAVAFTLAGVLGGVFAFRSMSALVRFTSFATGLEQLLVYGCASMVVFGATYFILPRLTGALWPSAKLVHVHFWATALGFLAAVVAWLVGGWQNGQLLANPAVAYADVLRAESSWFLVLKISAVLLLVGHVAFALNAFGMILKAPAPAGRHD